jgi:hypothetical protein
MKFAYVSPRALGIVKVKPREGSAAESAIARHTANTEALAVAVAADERKSTEATRAAVDAAREACAQSSIAAKAGWKFVPSPDHGVKRYLVTDEQADAIARAETPEARAAILAELTGISSKSPIAPSIFAYAGMYAGAVDRASDAESPSAVILRETRAGLLFLPTTGGEKSGTVKRTPEERDAENAAAMFAEADAAWRAAHPDADADASDDGGDA